MNIYTIGFTKKNAETFFGLLNKARVRTLIDVRLNNVSQLSGFAKRDDLQYFLKEICQVDYVHAPDLAPTEDMLKSFKKGELSWPDYEKRFLSLMSKRRIEDLLSKNHLENSCLLCSEHDPRFCHRRLAAEYLKKKSISEIKIKHL